MIQINFPQVKKCLIIPIQDSELKLPTRIECTKLSFIIQIIRPTFELTRLCNHFQMTFDVQSTCVNFLKFLEDPNEQYYCLPYVVFFVWCIIATIGFIIYFSKCCFGEGIQTMIQNPVQNKNNL